MRWTLEQTDSFARREYFYGIIKELFRKSIHLCTGFVPLFLTINTNLTRILLFVALVSYICMEFLRHSGLNVPFVSKITALAARKRDENKFVLGPVTLVCGILISSFLWQPYHAAVGIYALAFGDGLASLGGKLFGRVEIPFTRGKTVEGSLTCFLAIFCVTFLHSGKVYESFLIALVGMFIELLPLKDFDNLLIPILLGGFSTLIA